MIETMSDVEVESTLKRGGYVVLDTGLAIDDSDRLTLDRWKQIGERVNAIFQKTKDKYRWSLGDWVNAFKGEWGDMYRQAMEVTGLAYEYLYELSATAGAYSTTERSLELSWSHFRYARKLPPHVRTKLLNEAFEKKQPYRDFHERVKKLNKERRTPEEEKKFSKRKPKDHVLCPNCEQVFPITGHRVTKEK